MQEAYLAALTRPPRSLGAVRAWLSRVVRNRSIQELRAASRRERREQAVSRDEEQEESQLSTERIDLQQQVCAQVLTLPEEQRTVLYLRYFEGLTPTQIARRLGVPVGTVKTRQMRGLAQLRARLNESYGSRSRWAVLLALAPRKQGSSVGPWKPGLASCAGSRPSKTTGIW